MTDPRIEPMALIMRDQYSRASGDGVQRWKQLATWNLEYVDALALEAARELVAHEKRQRAWWRRLRNWWARTFTMATTREAKGGEKV